MERRSTKQPIIGVLREQEAVARVKEIIRRPGNSEQTDQWFLDLADARRKIEAWRIDDNTRCPHSASGYATSAEFASSFQGHAPGRMTTSAQGGQTQPTHPE